MLKVALTLALIAAPAFAQQPGVVDVFDVTTPTAPKKIGTGVVVWANASVIAVITGYEAMEGVKLKAVGRGRPEIWSMSGDGFSDPERGVFVIPLPDLEETRALGPFRLSDSPPQTEEVLYLASAGKEQAGSVIGPGSKPGRLRVGVRAPLPDRVTALIDDKGDLAAVAVQKGDEVVKVPTALSSEGLKTLFAEAFADYISPPAVSLAPPPPAPPAPGEDSEEPEIVGIPGTVPAGVPPARRVSNKELLARAIERPQPDRPPHGSGSVVVEVTVDSAGRVAAARVLSGHPMLRYAAVETARKWKFRPANEAVVGAIVLNFGRE